MEIYLVRHTKVALSGDYCYGSSDVELADSREEDLAKVKQKLNGVQFDRSYTSPLTRCRLLSEVLVVNAVMENALIEMHLGEWELKKWADLDQENVKAWMNDFVNISPPGSESYMEYAVKPVLFFDELVRSSDRDDKVLLTSHSGAIRAIVCHVLNLPLANAFNFEIDYGSVSKIEVVDGWYKLKYLNY
ncbi:MAG: alpha-ribazole phosphatase family protein [Cytophagales bacterium]|nr:alpha-ribazole phosphatase family protein [Cytophagales bacterium]